MPDVFRAVVLSGGGARGAYGAGVLFGLRAMEALEQKRAGAPPESKTPRKHVYVGTSVGSLNAGMAAQGRLDELAEIYLKEATKECLIDDKTGKVTKSGMFMRGGRNPFYYFTSKGLVTLIEKYMDFARLKGAHLMVNATQYHTGELATFFYSDLMERFVADDAQLEEKRRRLRFYKPIDSKETLHAALQASSAIPFFFPPVTIGDDVYIDGGVGNNTPTRQAARFIRGLEMSKLGSVEFTVCAVYDPTSFVISPTTSADVGGVVQRTLEIFGNTLTEETLIAWERINAEVDKWRGQLANLRETIAADNEIPAAAKQRLVDALPGIFPTGWAGTSRVVNDIWIVRPTSPLDSESALDFDTVKSKKLMERGYEDFLTKALEKGKIDAAERKTLSAKTDLPFRKV